MSRYPFSHNGPVYIVYDHRFEIAYYSRLGKKYRRHRDTSCQTWEQTREQEIDKDTFWMVVACAEMGGRHA